VLNTTMYHTVLYGMFTSSGLCLESWLVFGLRFRPSIGWLLPLVCFMFYQQRNTQQRSFIHIWAGFHRYYNGKHSTINREWGICQARFIFTAVDTPYLIIDGFYRKWMFTHRFLVILLADGAGMDAPLMLGCANMMGLIRHLHRYDR